MLYEVITLLPVFALFFPVEIAVAATAFVHGANSLLKVAVIGRHADRELVVRFGIPAILAAFIGAFTLGYASHFSEIFRYSIGSRTAIITPIKLMMGMLMFIFRITSYNVCYTKLLRIDHITKF